MKNTNQYNKARAGIQAVMTARLIGLIFAGYYLLKYDIKGALMMLIMVALAGLTLPVTPSKPDD